MTETAEETVAHVRAIICANAKDTKVAIDGVDITDRLLGLQVSQRARELPTVILDVLPGSGQGPIAELDGLAKVYVATEEDPLDPGPAAAAFLAAIDAELLEKAALSRLDLQNEAYGLTRAMLATLVEWSTGGGAPGDGA